MPGIPHQIGVAERHNRTLMNMIRSMLSYNIIPLLLWMPTIKIAAYLLNRIPSKAAHKNPYELWTRRKPSLTHCCMGLLSKSDDI